MLEAFFLLNAYVIKTTGKKSIVPSEVAQIVQFEIAQIPSLLMQINWTSQNREVVKYALNRSMSPTMVAEYKEKLIPQEVLQRSLEEFIGAISKK